MISIDRLFSALMAERSLLITIGNNIGGGSGPEAGAATGAPAAVVAPPQEVDVTAGRQAPTRCQPT